MVSMNGHRCELRSGDGGRVADHTGDDAGTGVNINEPGDKPATISFATALRRVRSLRQHAALLDHLYELVVTRFFAEGVGNEPEYTVSLGREDVVVEGVIVEKVLTLLSDEMDRLRAEQRELEGGVVAVPRASQTHDETLISGEALADRDEVIANPTLARSGAPMNAKKKNGGDKASSPSE